MLEKLLDHITQQYIENSILAKLISSLVTVLLIVLCAIFVYYLVKCAINYFIKPLLQKSGSEFLHEFATSGRSGLFGHLSAALVFRLGSDFITKHDDLYSSYLSLIINKLSMVYLFITLVFIITSMIRQIDPYYERKFDRTGRYPIKPYLHVLIIIVWVFSIIVIIAFFSNSSLTTVFAGIGATSAVLVLIFKDTLLGIMANIQASVANIVRVGDRIALDKYGIDGIVLNISISYVRVRNLDNTISTIPTYMLTSEVIKNYRSVAEVGYRRIKCTLYIDINSIKRLGSDSINKSDLLNLLGKYKDIQLKDKFITNLELFRLCLEKYLHDCHCISKSNDVVVYQLAPTSTGVPVEIQAFTPLTNSVLYEHLQSQILDYSILKMREFNLVAFQSKNL